MAGDAVSVLTLDENVAGVALGLVMLLLFWYWMRTMARLIGAGDAVFVLRYWMRMMVK